MGYEKGGSNAIRQMKLSSVATGAREMISGGEAKEFKNSGRCLRF